MRNYSNMFNDICEENRISDNEASIVLQICSLFYALAKKRKGKKGISVAVSTSLSSIGVFFKRLGKV